MSLTNRLHRRLLFAMLHEGWEVRRAGIERTLFRHGYRAFLACRKRL